jgi:hypothetical protein
METVRNFLIEIVRFMREPRTVEDLAEILGPLLSAPSLPAVSRAEAVQSAREYVTQLGQQIEQEVIALLDELLGARSTVQDVNSLGAFGGASRICSILAVNQRFLFWKRIRRFATVRNTQTGEVKSYAPPQIDWMLFPIDGLLDELVRIANSAQENIKGWSSELRESRKNLLEYETAEEEQLTSQRNYRTTVAGVVLALVRARLDGGSEVLRNVLRLQGAATRSTPRNSSPVRWSVRARLSAAAVSSG